MVERQTLNERAPVQAGRLGRVLRIVELVEAALGALLVLTILTLVIIQVTVRFTALSGWPWTGELARFSLMWLTFILAGYLLGRDQHITLDIVDHLLSDRWRRVLHKSAYVIVALICMAFVREGIGLMDAQSIVKSSAAQIPMSYVYLVPTVGFALTAARALIGVFARKETA